MRISVKGKLKEQNFCKKNGIEIHVETGAWNGYCCPVLDKYIEVAEDFIFPEFKKSKSTKSIWQKIDELICNAKLEEATVLLAQENARASKGYGYLPYQSRRKNLNIYFFKDGAIAAIYEKINKSKVGWQAETSHHTAGIIYFQFETRQISFHTSFVPTEFNPEIKWDEKREEYKKFKVLRGKLVEIG